MNLKDILIFKIVIKNSAKKYSYSNYLTVEEIWPWRITAVIDGTLNISVNGNGSSAVYTVTGDITVTDYFLGLYL